MAKKPTAKKPTMIQRSRNVSAAAKALFNHGPNGSKRVYRSFFGVSDAEESEIEKFVGLRVDINLSRSTV